MSYNRKARASLRTVKDHVSWIFRPVKLSIACAAVFFVPENINATDDTPETKISKEEAYQM